METSARRVFTEVKNVSIQAFSPSWLSGSSVSCKAGCMHCLLAVSRAESLRQREGGEREGESASEMQ